MRSKYPWIVASILALAIMGIMSWRARTPELFGLRFGISREEVITKIRKYSIARDPTQPRGTAYVRPLFRSRYGIYSGPIFLGYCKDKLAKISLELCVHSAALIGNVDERRAKELTYERYEELMEELIEKYGEPTEETFGQQDDFFAHWESKSIAIHVALDSMVPHVIHLSYTYLPLWEEVQHKL